MSTFLRQMTDVRFQGGRVRDHGLWDCTVIVLLLTYVLIASMAFTPRTRQLLPAMWFLFLLRMPGPM